MTTHRSRQYLDLVYEDGVACACCGATATAFVPIDPAHYSGLFAHRLGKGGAQKVADVVSCPLCRKCHTTFDEYRMGNDDTRAAAFLVYCWEWLLRNLNTGRVRLEVVNPLRNAPDASQMTVTRATERPTKRKQPSRCTCKSDPSITCIVHPIKRASRCTASPKQVKRPEVFQR